MASAFQPMSVVADELANARRSDRGVTGDTPRGPGTVCCPHGIGWKADATAYHLNFPTRRIDSGT